MEISLMREKKLYDASFRGDIQSLDELLKEDEHVLNYYERPSPFRFNETPLHIAATRGHVDFAKALLQRRPNLVSELDSRLRSPLHSASANGHVEMVKLLLKADADVCLMEDKFGRTPLHLAAMDKGRVEVVNELVQTRPEAIMYPLNKAKTITILHLYVIRSGMKALDQLLEVDHTFLNSQDGEGNTILHNVVALKQWETMKHLVLKPQLAVDLKNANGFTASDLIKQMPEDPKNTENIEMRKLLLKTEFSKSFSHCNNTYNKNENLLEHKRDAILVAATVIASMTFQGAMNPPGGVWQENKSSYINKYGYQVNRTIVAGTSVMATNYSDYYTVYEVFNAASFVAAIITVLLLISGSPTFGTTWFHFMRQKIFMWFLTGIIWIIMITMVITYVIVMVATAPRDYPSVVNIGGCSVLALVGLIFIVFLVYICRLIIYIIWRVKKCRERSRGNADEEKRQGHSNTNNTTCCMSA
ncbi:hypothetical protein LguiB_018297 [Lonicera macranthoides]